ncbi:hypothetical protein N7475_006750 [Penicillium sp. IBT 31633x]|nr:hypothetical protein N7475_006750 [Penicillium sp. IBT 31633x]
MVPVQVHIGRLNSQYDEKFHSSQTESELEREQQDMFHKQYARFDEPGKMTDISIFATLNGLKLENFCDLSKKDRAAVTRGSLLIPAIFRFPKQHRQFRAPGKMLEFPTSESLTNSGVCPHVSKNNRGAIVETSAATPSNHPHPRPYSEFTIRMDRAVPIFPEQISNPQS